MNLVLGATGMLGYEICRLLFETGKPLRATVRNLFDQSTTYKLRALGVQLVHGDLRNRNSFIPALRGVSTVIATASSMPYSYIQEENDPKRVDENGMMDFIDAAAMAQVRHFIYISLSGNISVDFPLRNAKRTVEQHLRKSGMKFTILRPSFFMEAWLNKLMGFDAVEGKVRIFSTGRQPVSYISYFDVAKFAVASISNPIAHNATLELGGPEKLSQLEIVKIFEEVFERKIELENFPEAAIRNQLTTSLDHMQKSMAGLMLCMAKGDPIDMQYMRKAFQIKLKSVREYAQSRVLAH